MFVGARVQCPLLKKSWISSVSLCQRLWVLCSWKCGLLASRGYGNNGVQEPDMELNIVLGLQCLTSWGRGTASASDTEARMCPPLFCGENERRGTKMLAYLTVTCLPFSILNK